MLLNLTFYSLNWDFFGMYWSSILLILSDLSPPSCMVGFFHLTYVQYVNYCINISEDFRKILQFMSSLLLDYLCSTIVSSFIKTLFGFDVLFSVLSTWRITSFWESKEKKLLTFGKTEHSYICHVIKGTEERNATSWLCLEYLRWM